MSDFTNYQKAQADTRAASAEYDRAATALDLAKIKQRLAEIKSQHEPLAVLQDQAMTERDRLYAAAFYVVVGRMPS